MANKLSIMIKKDFSKLKLHKDKLKVSGDKVFFSIQGEGPTMGEPAVFLRLHLCNLSCSWCDTPYAVKKDNKAFWSEFEDWTIKETAERIKKAWKCEDRTKRPRLVITGGEPLLQKEALLELMYILGDKWEFEIETNGTLEPIPHRAGRKVQYNVSPKIDNSGNAKAVRYRPRILKEFNEEFDDVNFKFVVQNPSDLDEIEKDYIKGVGISRDKVILMPLGITSKDLKKNALKVAEYAKKKGFRILTRLQIELWGNARAT